MSPPGDVVASKLGSHNTKVVVGRALDNGHV